MNAMKMKVRSKALIGMIKKGVDILHHQFEENEELELQSIEKKRVEMENVIKANDEKIASLRDKEDIIKTKASDMEPFIEAQLKKIELEKSRLDDMLSRKESMLEQAKEVSDEIHSLIRMNTKMNHETIRMFEKIRTLTEEKKRNERLFSSSHSLFDTSRLAENIRLTLHGLTAHKEDDDVKECIAVNDESIQYRFELVKEGKVQGVYFFGVFNNPEKEVVVMRKQNDDNASLPPKIAIGSTSFSAVEEFDITQSEIDEVAIFALKKLLSIESGLEEK